MRLVQQNITSAVQVQFIYDDTKRYFIRRNLIKVIFGEQKKKRGSFSFSAVLFRNVNIHSRTLETAACRVKNREELRARIVRQLRLT